MPVSVQFKVSLHFPRWGNTKESTVQTFLFSASVIIPHFISEPFEIPKQPALENKTLESYIGNKGFKNC